MAEIEPGRRDTVLDCVALVEAALSGDEEGCRAVIDHCDPREVASALAACLGAVLAIVHGSQERALAMARGELGELLTAAQPPAGMGR